MTGGGSALDDDACAPATPGTPSAVADTALVISMLRLEILMLLKSSITIGILSGVDVANPHGALTGSTGRGTVGSRGWCQRVVARGIQLKNGQLIGKFRRDGAVEQASGESLMVCRCVAAAQGNTRGERAIFGVLGLMPDGNRRLETSHAPVRNLRGELHRNVCHGRRAADAHRTGAF